jgi:hypothetical protein
MKPKDTPPSPSPSRLEDSWINARAASQCLGISGITPASMGEGWLAYLPRRPPRAPIASRRQASMPSWRDEESRPASGCPPTLVPKWLRELRNRFAIDAEEADAETLRSKFERFAKRGPTESFALVTSYHALRPRKSEKQLLQPWLSIHGYDVEFEGAAPLNSWKPRPAFFRQGQAEIFARQSDWGPQPPVRGLRDRRRALFLAGRRVRAGPGRAARWTCRRRGGRGRRRSV